VIIGLESALQRKDWSTLYQSDQLDHLQVGPPTDNVQKSQNFEKTAFGLWLGFLT
jgi:hypothetical protein